MTSPRTARTALVISVLVFGASVLGLTAGTTFAATRAPQQLDLCTPGPVCATPTVPDLLPSDEPSGPATPTPTPTPTPTVSVTPAPGPVLVASTASIRYRDRAFRGEVSAENAVCSSDRTVQVKKLSRGPNRIVATRVTDASGGWTVTRPRAHGRFYALALGRSIDVAGVGLKCTRDRSRTIRR